MNVLVIGKGGREHAIVRKLSQSPSVEGLHAIAGNPGMVEAQSWPDPHPIKSDVLRFCIKEHIDLVVIGPEAELLAGLSDQLRESGIPTFGPSKAAAQLEGSKKFSKDFMTEFNLPCGKSTEVSNLQQTLEAAQNFKAPYVLKADGLCAGKGVFICQNLAELEKSARTLFEDKAFGEAGRLALLEEFLEGQEISYFVMTNGKDHISLPVFRDHKRLLDNDKGPNTGGMGAIGPVDLDEEILQKIESEIVQPTISGIQKRNFDYRGVIFIGIMLTENGPKILEYNVRFGDPEAQCIFGTLDSDLGEALLDIANGNIPVLSWSQSKIACVVLAAPGYPDSPQIGEKILGDFLSIKENSYGLAAGVGMNKDREYLTDGGRVLNIIGLGKDFKSSIKAAYDRANSISWPGLQKRTDIGKSLL